MPTGWAALTGGGFIAGIGFTVSLLIANLAFEGDQLEEAKLGVLSAALFASVATWIVFRATALLPTPLKIRALLGTADDDRRSRGPGRPRDATTSAGPRRRR